MKSYRLIMGLLCASITLLSLACAPRNNSTSAPFTSASNASETVAPDSENVFLGTPQGVGDGFFVRAQPWDTGKIVYVDAATQKAYIACSQAGCKHQDDLCPAYLGENANYAQYRDRFYALQSNVTGTQYLLKSRSNADLSWKELWKKDAPDGSALSASVFLGGGFAVIALEEIAYGTDSDETSSRTYFSVIALDTESGAIKELISKRLVPELSSFSILGIADGKAILYAVETPANTPSYNEIINGMLNSGKTFEDAEKAANQQINSVLTYSYTAIDLVTGASKEIVSAGADSFRPPADHTIVYKGNVFYYLLHEKEPDTIMMYCAATGATTVLLERDHIGYFGGMDGKLFYIVMEDGKCWWNYTDLANGKSVEMLKNTGTESVPLSIHCECKDWLQGLTSDGQQVLIRKEDFYAEKFDRAVPFDYPAIASKAGK